MLIHRITEGFDANAPLAIFVHGRAGNLNVMSLFRRALPDSMAILQVQAPFEDPLGGWSWWNVESPAATRGAQMKQSESLLRSTLSSILGAHQSRPQSVVAFGFSQGGAMLSMLISQSPPPQIQRIVFLSSFLLREHFIESSWERLPVFWAHGENDAVIPFTRAAEDVAMLEAAGALVDFHHDPVGHKVGAQSLRALRDWI